ncbi:peptidylprolyl isomerase [Rapidithrix thailandica]|uniref:Peptidylprolyl isomerase n=1 Tax=Rapidithrix thailandica TaxID=413964 RepID=A0AAW9S011_9BACT
MKFITKLIRGWITVLGAVLLFQANGMAQGQGEVVDKIVAKVDNYIILKSEVENAYIQMAANGEDLGDDAKCQILEQLIMNKILVAKAEIDSVIVDEKEVNQELNQRMDYFINQAGDEAKLERTLGKSLAEIKEELRDQVHERLVVQRMQSEIMQDVTVTPAQVKKYFNDIPKDSIPFLSQEVQVGQIVKNPEVSKSEKEKAKNKLLDIKAKIESGEETFEEMARKNSEDYGSAAKGGDLGWTGRGKMVSEFEAAALSLDPNEISNPVESEFGYHMIQLLERRGNRYRARHILVRPKSNTEDIGGAVTYLDSIRTLIQADSMSFELAVKDHSDDQMTRSNAGFFKDPTTNSSYVSTEGLDPVIFFAIDTMKIGSISEPIKFRTQDGKSAVRIIYYKASKDPHYANLKDDYQKLYIATLNSKKGEILREWIKNAKKDVFIDIDSDYAACKIMQEL